MVEAVEQRVLDRLVLLGAQQPELEVALGFDEASIPEQHDRSQWPDLRERFATAFKTRTRDEWAALSGTETETCIMPVLSLQEAPRSAHLAARNTFVEIEGVTQPAPAPRFSRTPGAIQRSPAEPGQHTSEVLADWGFSTQDLDRLRAAGWNVPAPSASMFAWAPIPKDFAELGSLAFAKLLLTQANVAVSPGIGFGEHGDAHVRIAMVENKHRIRQAIRNIRQVLADPARSIDLYLRGVGDNITPLKARG